MKKFRHVFLAKPNVSNWPTVPRQLKLALALTVILTIIGILVYGTSRNHRIERILKTQTTMAEILNFEIELKEKNAISRNNQWIPVEDLDGHIYSAYFDPRPEVVDRYYRLRNGNSITWALIRIIAILPTKIDKNRVDCVYKYMDVNRGNDFKRIRATSVEAIRDNWDLDYSAFFVICDLDVHENLEENVIGDYRRLPSFVTIINCDGEIAELTNATKFVDVRYSGRGIVTTYEMEEKFMAVCVPVLHHDFDRPHDLVEFVEYYRLLGTDRFTFYNSSISKNANRVLEYYAKREIANVLTWKLSENYIFETTLRNEGFFAAINDCLYRNSFDDDYDYVAIFDTTEYLVPRIHENFRELVEYVDPIADTSNDRASFVFRNVFFYTMYQDDQDNLDTDVPYLWTQAKTWRVEEPQRSGDLSRYIVRGRDTVEMGNYGVHELRKGSYAYYGQFYEVTVDLEVALTHHYSGCEAEETGCYLKPIVMDRTAHRFTRKLGIAVADTCKNIFGPAGCPFANEHVQP